MIAPLDWGLGHATRCIPIIRALLHNGYQVVVAAEGKQLFLLQQEFPHLQFLPLKGYHIRYSKKKYGLPFKMLSQVPQILAAIRYERNWLNKIIDEHDIDLVISDNRYGLYTQKIPCVFITHQLTVKVPNKWLESLVQKINYKFINRFAACWVPDMEGEKNIAAVLSHPLVMPKVPVHYIGVLSRFQQLDSNGYVYDYCMMLSGPEPQRTLLEENILQHINSITGKILLVRGKPGSNETLAVPMNVNVQNHLPENQLQQAIEQSEYVVSRSGYTTVMELLSLQKKSILIPTPGQTEQEYLAEKLMQQGWCYATSQNNFDATTFAAAQKFSYALPKLEQGRLHALIPQLVEALKK